MGWDVYLEADGYNLLRCNDQVILSGATGYLRNPFLLSGFFPEDDEPTEVDFIAEMPNAFLIILVDFYDDITRKIELAYDFPDQYGQLLKFKDMMREFHIYQNKVFEHASILPSHNKPSIDYVRELFNMIVDSFSGYIVFVILNCELLIDDKQPKLKYSVYDFQKNSLITSVHCLRRDACSKPDVAGETEFVKYFKREYSEAIDFMLLGCELQLAGKHPHVRSS